MLQVLTVDDISTGDTVRATSLIGRDVVGIVTDIDADEHGGVIDLRTDDGEDCWRRLDQVRIVVGADGIAKYATGPGWR